MRDAWQLGMQAQHATQPYDVPSNGQATGESLWTPSSATLDRVPANPAVSADPASTTTNVHGLERLASSLVGGLLLARGVGERSTTSKLLALVGSALVYRGISGHCHLYQALGIDTSERRRAA